MQLHLIAVGRRMPAWVQAGYEEYAKRLPAESRLHLSEIPAEKRGKNADFSRLLTREGARMLSAVPKGAHVVALAVEGRPWVTEHLANRLGEWLQGGRDIALLVGGPEGLAPECYERAEERWSLSPLTLPHPLVRIIVAEQLYRAWTLLNGHPYHR